MSNGKLNRRSFIASGAMLAAVSAVPRVNAAGTSSKSDNTPTPAPSLKPLIVSHPMLQNGAATSIGVAWQVSAEANGFVEYSRSPDLANSKIVKCGGYRVTAMNDKVMQVRLTGLKPATRYYYRISADRIEYKGGYAMKILGHEVDPRIYSFVTLGEDAASHFCVINDTHAQMKSFGLVTDKIAELKPACVVWNGDACNTQETIDSLLPIFLSPNIERKDYASEIPYLFEPGNHDNRGRAAREIEKVLMFRQPEERPSRDWDLGRNFAVRCGDIAMIGLDTGEDKLDSVDIFAGLFNMEPYREAQAVWLKDALERPEIKSAPYLVAFCHIPLFDSDPKSNPGDCIGSDGGKYSAGFAYWQRTCKNLWCPLLEKAGCQVIITAHQHEYRYDAPTSDRPWGQIVGGGPELGAIYNWKTKVSTPAPTRFPTVIEGEVKDGKLKMTVHDVFNRRVVSVMEYESRKRSWLPW